jgi:NADH-quinone oxidoreductase subunit C
MKSLEQIAGWIAAAMPEARVKIVPNPALPGQSSLLLGHRTAVAVARFLRDDPALRLDYCSNVTGIDWPPEHETKTPAPGSKPAAAGALEKKAPAPRAEQQPGLLEGAYYFEGGVHEASDDLQPGFLEVVYHLYSVALKRGPVVIRMRTADRAERCHLPSLTPVWKSAELQEREAFDLFGIRFDGHPDLRRILMWDEFKDYPMRKDYREPDDYDYEPTPHDDVVEKAARHASTPAQPFAGA